MFSQAHSTGNIPPNSPTPPESLIEAAMRDVPPTLADMENTTEYGAGRPEPGQRIVPYYRLVRELTEKRQHGKAAAQWAIHRLVEQGMLTLHPGRGSTPGVIGLDGAWKLTPISYALSDMTFSLIQSTPRLWTWWREREEERDNANTTRRSVELSKAIGTRANGIAEATATAAGAETPGNTFRREGDIWTLTYANQTIRLPDSLGLKCLAQLIAKKGCAIDAALLRATISGAAAVKPSAGIDVLDSQAIGRYRDEYEDLDFQLEEAKENHDLARQEQLQTKLDAFAQQLASAQGFGGRIRKSKDESANARTSLTNAIHRTMERIQAKHAALGRHLDTSIRSGQSFCYAPETDVDWDL